MMSGDCFSVLVILFLHRFDLPLHASLMAVYLYSMFLFIYLLLLFFLNNSLGEKLQEFYFFFSWYDKYCMYFRLLSQFIAH